MKRILQVMTSYMAMAVLLLIYAVAMGIATFVESRYGTLAAKVWVYNNWWFFILHLLLVFTLVGVTIRQKLVRQRKWATLIFHYAFGVIMLGALVTFWTGKEGFMHIREGESSVVMLDPQNPAKVMRELPFEVELEDFRLVRYPGSNSPSSYESDVLIRQAGKTDRYEKIYMNNVVHVGGYRLYQTSYDRDEGGTILTVNYDLAGMIITYVGYVLLLGGMLFALFHKHSRFRTLARSLGRAAVVAAVVLSLSAQDAAAQQQQQQGGRVLDRQREKRMAQVYAVDVALDKEVAREFGRLMVQEGKGRVEPVDTYATKLLRKIYRKNNYNGLSADQVILGAIMQPNVWSRVPFINVSSNRLREEAGGGDEKGYLAFIDVLNDGGEYIFADEMEQLYAKPARERNKYEKELLKLDEKVNILMGLFNGEMFPILPNDKDGMWYSPGDDLSVFRGQDSMFVMRIFPWFATESLRVLNEDGRDWSKVREIIGMLATYQHAKARDMEHVDARRIEAEMLYNRLSVFKWAGFGLMGMGLVLLLVLSLGVGNEQKRGVRVGVGILTAVIVGLFLWTSFGIGLRWYISGRPPVSNAYESMVFIGWAAALGGLFFVRKSKMTMALAIFLGGVLLFVSNLNWMDPEITPLVPVLKSPWLMVHVATITGSYGLFGIGFLLGLISLIMMACRNGKNSGRIDGQVREFTTINEMLLIVGLVLLTAGTFIGAVWANESWGRYWGWDPKETWALITIVVYAFITHVRFIPRIGNLENYPYVFSLMSVVGVGSVLMTFFGVNYFLGGMHSYAGDAVPTGLYAIWFVYAAVAIVAVLAWRKRVLR